MRAAHGDPIKNENGQVGDQQSCCTQPLFLIIAISDVTEVHL